MVMEMPRHHWIWIQNLLCVVVLILGPAKAGFGDHLEGVFRWGVQVLGGALILRGAWLGIAGVRDLGSSRTPHPQPLEGGQLVTHGVYARVRHPLYSSLVHVAFGWSVVWGSPAAMAASVGLTVWLIAKARLEERLMRGKFPEYEAYQNRVRRF
jgi:protein-S-isoprenylcysteine O-methyltransferase Ste14